MDLRGIEYVPGDYENYKNNQNDNENYDENYDENEEYSENENDQSRPLDTVRSVVTVSTTESSPRTYKPTTPTELKIIPDNSTMDEMTESPEILIYEPEQPVESPGQGEETETVFSFSQKHLRVKMTVLNPDIEKIPNSGSGNSVPASPKIKNKVENKNENKIENKVENLTPEKKLKKSPGKNKKKIENPLENSASISDELDILLPLDFAKKNIVKSPKKNDQKIDRNQKREMKKDEIDEDKNYKPRENEMKIMGKSARKEKDKEVEEGEIDVDALLYRNR